MQQNEYIENGQFLYVGLDVATFHLFHTGIEGTSKHNRDQQVGDPL